MEIIKKIKESESIIIEGDKKVGKMTLALYLAKIIKESTTFISPLPTSKVIKKIELLSESFKIFSSLKNYLLIFTLREDWVSIKNEYGHKYLLQDLEYLISTQTNDIIIFHKIASFFEYADRDFIESFLSELLGYGINYKKKLIFTLNMNDINYDIISRFLIDNSDLYLKMDMMGNVRKITILYSLTSTIQQEYIFKQENDMISLKSKSTLDNKNSDKDISIVFISNNLHSRQLHKYILDKENIDLVIVNTISDSLNAMLNDPDYLIFEQEGDEVKLSICEISKKHKLNTQIVYIVNKSFIRVDDRMKAKNLGCIDMIKIDENIMNYILELEKYFNSTFYKKPIDENSSNKFTNLNDFKKYIRKVIKARCLFTLVKVKNVLNDEEFSSLRDYDKVFVSKNESVIFIFNTLKSNIKNILAHKFNTKLEILEIRDSLDIFFKG